MSWKKTKDKRIKKRVDTYWARFSKRGVLVETSLSTANFDLAVEITNKIERAILNQENYKDILAGGPDKDLTPLIGEHWPNFINDKTHGNIKKNIRKNRERTLIEYVNYWERSFEPFWGNKRLDEITEDNWEAFILYARECSDKKGQLKIFNSWKIFSAFCTWAFKNGHVSKKPTIWNPDPDTFSDELEERDGIGINLSDEQLRNLREGSAGNPRFHLWILMAQYMGMRSSEISQLRKDRVSTDLGLIKLRKSDTKTKQARDIPIHPLISDLFWAQMKAATGTHLFPNRNDGERAMDPGGFKKPWTELRVKFEIECRFHDLRHSCATRIFADHKINPAIGCKILGMSMKVAMEVYIHFTPEQLTEAMAGFFKNSTQDGQISDKTAKRPFQMETP